MVVGTTSLPLNQTGNVTFNLNGEEIIRNVKHGDLIGIRVLQSEPIKFVTLEYDRPHCCGAVSDVFGPHLTFGHNSHEQLISGSTALLTKSSLKLAPSIQPIIRGKEN